MDITDDKTGNILGVFVGSCQVTGDIKKYVSELKVGATIYLDDPGLPETGPLSHGYSLGVVHCIEEWEKDNSRGLMFLLPVDGDDAMYRGFVLTDCGLGYYVIVKSDEEDGTSRPRYEKGLDVFFSGIRDFYDYGFGITIPPEGDNLGVKHFPYYEPFISEGSLDNEDLDNFIKDTLRSFRDVINLGKSAGQKTTEEGVTETPGSGEAEPKSSGEK